MSPSGEKKKKEFRPDCAWKSGLWNIRGEMRHNLDPRPRMDVLHRLRPHICGLFRQRMRADPLTNGVDRIKDLTERKEKRKGGKLPFYLLGLSLGKGAENLQLILSSQSTKLRL